jgi:hypothetical protein
MVLRRYDPTHIPTECESPVKMRSVLEWLFPIDSRERLARGERPNICTRIIKVRCDQELGFGRRSVDVDFRKSNLEIVNVRLDPIY